MFAENSLKDKFNNERLIKLNYPLIETPSLNKTTPGVCHLELATNENRSQSQASGLAKLFGFKKSSSRVILATNFSTDDRLVNVQLGTVGDTKQDSLGILGKIYVIFENENAGLTKMRKNRYASEHASKNNIVPIVRIEAKFSVFLNSMPTIYGTQFSLMLVFTCRVHKVQVLTLPSIAVSFNLSRQKKFSYEHLYVVLSRVKSGNLTRNLMFKNITNCRWILCCTSQCLIIARACI